MPRFATATYLSLMVALSMSVPLKAGTTSGSAYDRYAQQAQSSFDNGKFLLAEKTWRRALKAATKTGDSQQIVTATLGVGKSLVKEGKYQLAQGMYGQALKLSKDQNLDPSAINSQLGELWAIYKPIDWSSARADVSKFLNDVGLQNAYATKESATSTTQISASLPKKWMKSTDDMYREYGPPSKLTADASGTANGAAPAQMPENPVKKVRLDRLIKFDIIRESKDRYRIANIKGISANVGLWVKIADVVLAIDERNEPYAEVRAGTMGISRTEKVKLPVEAYNQLKDGVDQIDPFVAGSNGTLAPSTQASPQ